MNSIDFAVWQSQATSLEHMIAYDYIDSTMVVGGEASRMRDRVGVGRVLGGQRRAGRCSARCRRRTIRRCWC